MDVVEDAVCNMRQYPNPGNFAMIAKISLGLRKFRKPSEIEKFRKAREISLCSENHCA